MPVVMTLGLTVRWEEEASGVETYKKPTANKAYKPSFWLVGSRRRIISRSGTSVVYRSATTPMVELVGSKMSSRRHVKSTFWLCDSHNIELRSQ